MVIWLIGLSGAGKTTIGTQLYEILKTENQATVLLDGDVLREVWGDAPGHDIDGRRINAQRISQLCQMLDKQGIDVVASVLSIFPEWQKWNRDNFSIYYEVFIDAPLELVQQRDPKGLYAAADKGEMKNVVGIDIPFPRPAQPNMTITAEDMEQSPTVLAQRIKKSLRQ